MKYEDLKWERRNEYEWRAAVQGGYEIIWQVRDDGIAVLHGPPPSDRGSDTNEDNRRRYRQGQKSLGPH